MNSEEKLEWIEQYLDGKLSGQELLAFEQKLATDKAFAQEVKLQQEISVALTENDVIELSKKIRSIQHQRKQQSGGHGRIIIFKRLLQIAAGLALLVAVYFIYENFNQTYSPQELAAQYFSIDETIDHQSMDLERSVSDSNLNESINDLEKILDDLWKEIQTAYDQKIYHLALKKMGEIETLDPNFESQSPDEFYYYQGLFLMMNNNPKTAVESFKKVKTTYTEKATWYSVKCYLELEDIQNAKRQLEKISATPNPFKVKADSLLKDIEKIN